MYSLSIGDEVYTGPLRGRGGHGAYIVITKLNNKSIVGVERKGSYKTGMEWRLGSGIELAKVTYDGERTDSVTGQKHTGLMQTRWGRLNVTNKVAYID